MLRPTKDLFISMRANNKRLVKLYSSSSGRQTGGRAAGKRAAAYLLLRSTLRIIFYKRRKKFDPMREISFKSESRTQFGLDFRRFDIGSSSLRLLFASD